MEIQQDSVRSEILQTDDESSDLDHISIGTIQKRYSANGARILRYYVDLWHEELDLHKQLSAPELYLLQNKIDALIVSWNKKVVEHRKKALITAGKDTADQMTIEASKQLKALSNILTHSFSVKNLVDWESLKDKRAPAQKPICQKIPEPVYILPKLSFWDTVLGRKERKLQNAQSRHALAIEEWKKQEHNAEILFTRQIAEWEIKKAEFLAEQAETNAKVDALAHGVLAGDAQSIIEHSMLVLERSDYSDLFEKSFEVDYILAERLLLIEYSLPSPDNMPTLKTVRFMQATGEMKETFISERERKFNYDTTCYQICLRTIHEILEADESKNIEKVLFNGFATYVDRTTGQDTTSCIMSVLVKRSDFDALDLSRVDPKVCFKSLKGVSASTLSALAPVPPVMELNREDRRFIEAKSMVGDLSGVTNLAAMDWADFEYLVRELFEKEFASRGGEVKITQASRDGGVDAVAFDPDPITGGKIVIQAKRYTRTVGVNAVRDLFGTMQHESASRGILITTADFGPDAYSFASGKPITLFTGANLLHLLEKHGYQAKIDLKEARKDLNLRDYS